MHRMAEHLRYFIFKRASEEASWQGIEIIFSGPDVPGEGEHKIMEYIRCSKAQPDYNPNLRHCLYGLDADLILLGLLSHDPHFALLREEVLFGPQSRKPRTLAQTRFFLMHLGLLRDYIDAEFRSSYAPDGSLAIDYGKVPFEHYSLECIIDDFILMTVFVGNDFLPGLPYLHIGENAIGMMFDAYKKMLKSSGGKFMNNAGKVDFSRAAKFLDELRYLEKEQFGRSGHSVGKKSSNETMVPAHKELYKLLRAELITNDLAESWSSEGRMKFDAKDKKFLWKLAFDFGLKFELDQQHGFVLTKGPPDSDSEAEEDAGEYVCNQDMIRRYDQCVAGAEDGAAADGAAFSEWKFRFYSEKLHFKEEHEVKGLLAAYLTGIQWNMYYYYKGIVDWAWFYPYHYGPYLTDVADFMASFECPEFVMGKPYAPLEQLLAVLPAASAAHVPKPFAELMTDPYSPILSFYPSKFEQDLNGKKSPWEAVVLIPFIDEERLLVAVEAVSGQLTADEQERNSFGSSTLFTHSPSHGTTIEPPPRSNYAAIQNCHCKVLQYDLPVMEVAYSFKPELLPGVKPLAGFSTLKNMPHCARLDSIGIALFGGKITKAVSLVLSLLPAPSAKPVDTLSAELTGKRMYAAWPFLHEGLVVKLTDGLFVYDGATKRPMGDAERKEHDRTVVRLIEDSKRLMAIDLDDVETVAWVAPLAGMKREADGSTRKDFAHPSAALPYPLVALLVPEECIEDPRYLELAAKSLQEEYPVGSPCVYTGPEKGGVLYGALATVTGSSETALDVEVMRRLPFGPEPTFAFKLAQDALHSQPFIPARAVADRLRLHPLFLSKITSSWFLFFGDDLEKSSNIGLGLKFDSRGQCVVGYSRKSPVDGTWEFSEQAVSLVREYVAAFPDLCGALQRGCTRHQTQVSEILGPDVTKASLPKKLEGVKAWIKSRTEGLHQMPVDTVLLSPEAVSKIHEGWQEYASRHTDTKQVVLKGLAPKTLVHEGMAQFTTDSASRFRVGDRVRFVGSGAAGIPFGVTGIIVGLDGNSSGSSALAHILLDEPLIGIGKTLSGLCPANFGVSVSRRYLVNLNAPSPAGRLQAHAPKPTIHSPKTFNGPARPRPAVAKGLHEKPPVQSLQQNFQRLAVRPPAIAAKGARITPGLQPTSSTPDLLAALFSAHSHPPPAQKTQPPPEHPSRTRPHQHADAARRPPARIVYTASATAHPPKPQKPQHHPQASAVAEAKPAGPTIVYSTKKRLLKPDLSWTKE